MENIGIPRSGMSFYLCTVILIFDFCILIFAVHVMDVLMRRGIEFVQRLWR